MSPQSSAESYPAFALNGLRENPEKTSIRLFCMVVKLTLTLREEQRLMVFENKVLRKIFGAKRDEVTGEWGKLHNAELHRLFSLPDIISNIKSRRLRWAEHVARIGESRNAYRVLGGDRREKDHWGGRDFYINKEREKGKEVNKNALEEKEVKKRWKCFPFHNSNTNTPLHAIVIQTRKEAVIKPERIERLLSSLNQTTETSENRKCQSSENRSEPILATREAGEVLKSAQLNYFSYYHTMTWYQHDVVPSPTAIQDLPKNTDSHSLKATLTLSSSLPPHVTFSPTPTLANQNAKPHCQAEVEVQSISKRLKLLPLYELKRSRKTLLSYETVLVSSRYRLLSLQNCLQLPLSARRLNLVELYLVIPYSE
ncbi:hypothetical protein ANN_22029 [Periplaneta americana]|uniref:Uncharacterized protein n=1 Tax=Periplaneta americana TaxID=6978 RepID=A0ABQ8S7W0_PERAM|nr:hypothetical protein ANN_22029 [Periplaneta americana]